MLLFLNSWNDYIEYNIPFESLKMHQLWVVVIKRWLNDIFHSKFLD